MNDGFSSCSKEQIPISSFLYNPLTVLSLFSVEGSKKDAYYLVELIDGAALRYRRNQTSMGER